MRFLQGSGYAVAALGCVLLGGLAASAEDTANLGTLKKDGQTLVFKHVVAVRGASYKEPRILILATQQPVSAATLDKVRRKEAEDNVDAEVGQPYLKGVLRENGEARYLYGRGNNLSFMKFFKDAANLASVKDGRVTGELTSIETGNFARDATLKFDLVIGDSAATKPVAQEAPVKPTVEGTFLGEGQDGKLRFVSVLEHEPFNDQPAVTIVFTEKDHAASKKPAFDAGFGKFGNALILSVHHNGGIFGCEVAHAAHQRRPFSAIGKIQMTEFDLSTGNAKGAVSTGGVLDAFGQKWAVDLKFAAPLPDSLRKSLAQPATANAGSTPPSPVTAKESKPVDAGPHFVAQQLALPADAKNVEYKALVGHITFESDLTVTQLVTEFSAKLKEQGWKEAPGGLIGQKNATLKRELGAAKLSITIQPRETGSLARIFTEGVDFKTGAEANVGKSKKPKKPAASADDIEKEAKEQIKKALGTLPKGLFDDDE